MKIYASGKTAQQQREHDARYRARQRAARAWISDLAAALEVPKERITSSGAARVASLIKEEF